MNLVERDGLRRMAGCFPGSLLWATLVPSAAIGPGNDHASARTTAAVAPPDRDSCWPTQRRSPWTV